MRREFEGGVYADLRLRNCPCAIFIHIRAYYISHVANFFFFFFFFFIQRHFKGGRGAAIFRGNTVFTKGSLSVAINQSDATLHLLQELDRKWLMSSSCSYKCRMIVSN